MDVVRDLWMKKPPGSDALHILTHCNAGWLATVYGCLLAIGEVKLLTDSEMDIVLEKFGSYGLQDS